MKKWLIGIASGLVVLVLVLFFARNFIARESVEIGAKRITGFSLTIGSVDLGVFSSKVDVHDLKLMNPPEFPEPMFVDMPQLFVDYQFGSMISGAPHINNMIINIKQLVVVKNSKGESNAMKLKGVVSSGNSNNKSASKSKFAVDTLHIYIGTVTVKDFSRAKPYERSIKFDNTVTYQNITESTDISRLILLTVMNQAHIPEIGLSPDDLKKDLNGVTSGADKVLKGASDAVSNLFSGFGTSQPKKK